MKIKTILALFLLILLILPGSTDTLYAQDILEPVVAGQFYPGDSDELRASIKEYLGKYTTEEFPAGIYGIISPHAGYVYSGPVAAGAYKQLEGRKYDAVVVLAPSHRESFSHVSIYPGDGIRTPLGVINIDKELAKELAEKNKKDIKFSKNGYSGEHSLEVQLPFIQSVLPNTPIVPMVIGHQSFDLSYSLGKSLGAVLKGKNVLVVASTDLSHFHPQAEANKLDGMVADAVGDYDTFLLGQNIFSGQCEACGGTAVIAVMEAAKIMGSNTAKVMKYATSGDITGDKSQVVGYLSAVLTHEEKPDYIYSETEREQLLKIARETVESTIRGINLPDPGELPEKFRKKKGVFVTLKIGGELRGCIGYIFAESPLLEAVRSNAVSAATKDPRFRPVSTVELPLLEYEISVLSPLTLIENTDDIEVGKHGLLLVSSPRSGLLLPQVPVELGWNRQQFLEGTCQKAGLPKDAWKDPNILIFTFSAEVFGEKDK